jgi:MFS transporter, SP family, solute carrier family 2 (facilitated glucose transporter), member 3
MSDTAFSLVTSMFTVGGFLGSFTSSMVMESHGRKAALQINGLSVAVGSGLMAIAPSTFLLLLGRQLACSTAATTSCLLACRFLTGYGAGIGLCAGPVFLAEIAPSKIRGSVGTVCAFPSTYSSSLPKTGVLTQLAIVLGIMVTQMLGLRMATPTLWRFVFSFSSVASVMQLCLSRFIVETPVWLKQHGKPEDSRLVQKSLFQEPGDPGSCCTSCFLWNPRPFHRVFKQR